MDQPALFDLDQIARDAVTDTPWHGSPLTFTTGYYSPTEHQEAWDRWKAERGQLGMRRKSHMWTTAPATFSMPAGTHHLDILSADLRCEHREPCACVGDLLYLAICEPCAWHQITDEENGAVEAWHDHAIPAWRELPPLPKGIDHDSPKAATFVDKHYPEQWKREGAPIRTHRSPHGGRHVSGRSPFGGYDLAAPTS